MKLFIGTITGCCALAIASFSSMAGAIEMIDVEVPVLYSEPAYKTVVEKRPVEQCREVTVNKKGSTSSHTAELLGAVLGGALGKEIDGSDG